MGLVLLWWANSRRDELVRSVADRPTQSCRRRLSPVWTELCGGGGVNKIAGIEPAILF